MSFVQPYDFVNTPYAYEVHCNTIFGWPNIAIGLTKIGTARLCRELFPADNLDTQSLYGQCNRCGNFFNVSDGSLRMEYRQNPHINVSALSESENCGCLPNLVWTFHICYL